LQLAIGAGKILAVVFAQAGQAVGILVMKYLVLKLQRQMGATGGGLVGFEIEKLNGLALALLELISNAKQPAKRLKAYF